MDLKTWGRAGTHRSSGNLFTTSQIAGRDCPHLHPASLIQQIHPTDARRMLVSRRRSSAATSERSLSAANPDVAATSVVAQIRGSLMCARGLRLTVVLCD